MKETNMSDIILTDEQNQAVKLIKDWYLNFKGKKKTFVLAGIAGSGKTTIIRNIIDDLGLSEFAVRYAAFTGKAAMVLRSKGLDASTIHSLIYIPFESYDQHGDPIITFHLSDKLRDSGVKLICVDEASMVGSDIKEDLESFGIPILYIGDHKQLPPVSADQINLMNNPDYKLETIHRQALGNPIIYVASLARTGNFIKYGTYGTKVKKIHRVDLPEESMLQATQVLCGKNVTREKLNKQIREMLKKDTPFPLVDDKLICLKNNGENGLINGMTGYCTQYILKRHVLDFIDDEGIAYKNLRVYPELFVGGKPEKYQRSIEQFTYGYAITVHKSQGSQYEKLIVFEEYLGDKEFHNRWLYTGVTRAVDKLIIVSG
jgi:exodeoxyribonuclease-5